ncbi:hypothetical protein M0Q50_05220 [bacterium]|jgi:hypothetical protein|nr:hypothetical protein [bacterium]
MKKIKKMTDFLNTKNYKKGKILNLGELKSLPENSIVHLKYYDEYDHIRINDFVIFCGYKGSDEFHFKGGWSIPTQILSDTDLLKNIDNSDWNYTISEAIKL